MFFSPSSYGSLSKQIFEEGPSSSWSVLLFSSHAVPLSICIVWVFFLICCRIPCTSLFRFSLRVPLPCFSLIPAQGEPVLSFFPPLLTLFFFSTLPLRNASLCRSALPLFPLFCCCWLIFLLSPIVSLVPFDKGAFSLEFFLWESALFSRPFCLDGFVRFFVYLLFFCFFSLCRRICFHPGASISSINLFLFPLSSGPLHPLPLSWICEYFPFILIHFPLFCFFCS